MTTTELNYSIDSSDFYPDQCFDLNQSIETEMNINTSPSDDFSKSVDPLTASDLLSKSVDPLIASNSFPKIEPTYLTETMRIYDEDITEEESGPVNTDNALEKKTLTTLNEEDVKEQISKKNDSWEELSEMKAIILNVENPINTQKNQVRNSIWEKIDLNTLDETEIFSPCTDRTSFYRGVSPLNPVQKKQKSPSTFNFRSKAVISSKKNITTKIQNLDSPDVKENIQNISSEETPKKSNTNFPSKIPTKKIISPKIQTPSKQTSSKQTPSKQIPLKQTPSKQIPLKQTPSKQIPLKQIPSKSTSKNLRLSITNISSPVRAPLTNNKSSRLSMTNITTPTRASLTNNKTSNLKTPTNLKSPTNYKTTNLKTPTNYKITNNPKLLTTPTNSKKNSTTTPSVKQSIYSTPKTTTTNSDSRRTSLSKKEISQIESELKKKNENQKNNSDSSLTNRNDSNENLAVGKTPREKAFEQRICLLEERVSDLESKLSQILSKQN